MSESYTAWTPSFMERMLRQTCQFCGAEPGDPCTTKSGQKTKPHSARFYDARAEQEAAPQE
jgi:hypothetical protein